uniref:DALR anticodon binding domain-containing protein n=1 Tax=Ditylenchus dipsaci TaxID=166011 RepID=A0A915DJ61_9BILA
MPFSIDETSTGFSVFIAILMVVSGSMNTIAAKWADSIEVNGVLFDHPFFQATCMFVGELSCLVVYFIIYFIRKHYWQRRHAVGESGAVLELDDELAEEPTLPKFSALIFLPPACCDVVATSLMYIGLNLTTASSYQMLRGAVIIFTGLLSVAFLRTRLQAFKWLGMAFVTAGLVVVGVSDIMFDDNPHDDMNAIITGDLLIVMAQIIVAIQMVTEQKFVLQYDVPPLLAVGLEGLFGLAIISFLMIPMYFIHVPATFSKNPEFRLEDVIFAFQEMYAKPQILMALLLTIVSIAFFNFAGVSVTKRLSATSRMVLDSVRTLIIWMVCIPLFGEKFIALQLLGFALLILGMFVYNDIFSDLSATKRICQRLGIVSPIKPTKPNLILSPMEDLRLCSGKLSWSQRNGKDIFAPTHKVRNLLQDYTGQLLFESTAVDGVPYVWISNIKDVLEQRMRRLQENRNLDFGGNFKGKLFLCLVGNVRKANSFNSLLLVSLFDDDDGYSNLSNLQPVFHQLKFNKLIGHDVVWYLTGDLKFIGALYGHLGSASVYPCIFCEAEPNQAWYQSFTGNHVRKLLTGDGPHKIAQAVCCNEKHEGYEQLLTLLGQIQSMAESTFLSNEQVIVLGKWTDEFFLCLKEKFPDASITPNRAKVVKRAVVQKESSQAMLHQLRSILQSSNLCKDALSKKSINKLKVVTGGNNLPYWVPIGDRPSEEQWKDMSSRRKVEFLTKCYANANTHINSNPKLSERVHALFGQMEASLMSNPSSADCELPAIQLWQEWRAFSKDYLNGFYQQFGIEFSEWDCESAHVLEAQALSSQPVVLRKSDKSTLYLTRDLGAIHSRHRRFDADQYMYVVDSSQRNHFAQLKEILSLVKKEELSEKIKHISYGRVIGLSTRGGKNDSVDFLIESGELEAKSFLEQSPTIKLKSEELPVTSQKVSRSIIIYESLRRKKFVEHTFSFRDSFSEHSGLSIQEKYSRINSMELANCDVMDVVNARMRNGDFGKLKLEATALATDLAKLLGEFDDAVLSAYEQCEPAVITAHLMKLAVQCGRSSRSLKVKGEPEAIAVPRMMLFAATKKVLGEGMKMLGIEPLPKL